MNKPGTSVISARSGKVIAIIIVTLCLSVYGHRSILLTGERMATHDTITGYSLFYITADAAVRGQLPLWDPYTNCGEPFFLIYGTNYVSFLDPVNLALVLLHWLFRISLLTLYHWQLYLRFMIFVIGGYLFYRRLLGHRFSAAYCGLILLFSSLSIIYLRQLSFLFPWLLPYLLWFSVLIIEDKKYRYLIPFGFCFGLTLMNAWFMYAVFTWLLFLLVFYLPAALAWLKNKYTARRQIPVVAATAGKFNTLRVSLLIGVLLLAGIVLQSIPIFLYRNDVVPVARLQVTGSQIIDAIRVNYDQMGGSPSQWFDFLPLLYPYFASQYFIGYLPKLRTEEGIMYLGNLAPLFILAGVWFSRSRYRVKSIVFVAALMLVMLGKKAYLIKLFYYTIPGFSMIRNMEFFMPHFLLGVILLAGLGFDYLQDSYHEARPELLIGLRKLGGVTTLILTAGLLLITMLSITGRFLSPVVTAVIVQNLALTLSAGIIFFYLCYRLPADGQHHLRLGLIAVISLLELCLLNKAHYPLVTRPVDLAGLFDQSRDPSYADRRVLREDFPYIFSWYHPAAKKISTAICHYHPLGTHHVELKRFYAFRTSDIPEASKDIITGITVPKLKLYARARIVPEPAALAILRQMPAAALRDTVILEEALPAAFAALTEGADTGPTPPGEIGAIVVTRFSENRLELRVEARQNALLYYSDVYDRHWQAFIDDQPATIYPANYAFKSIIVSPGSHRVRFVYNPRWYLRLSILYFLSLTLAGAAGAGYLCRRFRKE